MRNIIVDFQNSDTWKIQVTIATNFIYSKEAEEECVMHSSSDNIKLASYNDVNKVDDELSESLRSRYQEYLETSMKRSDFILDSVQLMFYKCHKVNIRRVDSNIDSPG